MGKDNADAALLGPFAARFVLEGALGTGGYGTVYRALDRVQRRHVALKVPHTFDARALLALKEEFRALAGISHPNLVAFHELFVGPERWFFTMDLVRGVDCLRWVERAGGASAPQVLCGLAAGLEALHSARIVHRDLKPSNAWVDARGIPVLLDFGLARDLDRAPGAEGLAGTPLYLAPELLRGGVPSPASDLYALGVVLHEMAVGRPPFEGTAAAVLGAKLLGGPVRVEELRQGAPRELAPLVEALLHPDPSQRPTAGEVVRAAERDLGPCRALASERPFVGRRSELALLERSLEAARSGVPRIVFVEGPAGIGKSSLVDRFLGSIERAELLVLRGRCSEHEAVPFKALDGLMDALARRLRDDDDLRERVVDAEALGLVSDVFPVFAEVLGEMGAAPRVAPRAVEPQERLSRVARALSRLLASVAAERALVLVVDDLQWADEDGARLLHEALATLVPTRLLLLALHRSDVESAPLALIERLERPSPRAGGASRGALLTERLVVPPLPLEDACVLLGASEPTDVERELLAAARGSPFLLETLAASGVSSLSTGPGLGPDVLASPALGSLVRGALVGGSLGVGVVVGGSPALGSETLVRRAVASRVASLTPSARALLETVCVAGHAIAHEVVAEALGIDVDVAALRSLGAARLVRTSPSPGPAGTLEVEAYHELLRAVDVELVGPARSRSIHGALARAFVARPDGNPMWACLHLQGSGELARAAGFAEEGAKRAARALAFARAAELYRFALAHHGTEGPRARELEVSLAEALADSGRGREAADAFLAASERALDPGTRHELTRRAAEQYLRAGFFEEGTRHLDAVLEAAGLEPRRTPRTAIVSLLGNRLWLRRAGLALSPSLEADAVPAPAEQRRIDALTSGAVGLSVVDSIRSADLMSEALRRCLASGDRTRLATALSWWAAFVANEGGPAEPTTRMVLAAARRETDAHGHAYARACFEAASGLAEFHLGHFGAARTHFDAGLKTFEQETQGTTKETSTLHLFHHATLAIDGRLDELSQRTEERVRISEARGERYALVNLRQGLMILRWLAADQPDRADEDLCRAMEGFDVGGFVVQHWFDVWGRIVVLLYRGQAREARAAWARARPRLVASLLVRTQFTRVHGLALEALTAAAVLAEGAGAWAERARLRAWAHAAVRRARAEDRGWTAALAATLEACLRGAEGDLDGARALLDATVPALERTELGLYAALVRHHLGASDPRHRAVAEAWAEREGVVELDRLAHAILPGLRGLHRGPRLEQALSPRRSR